MMLKLRFKLRKFLCYVGYHKWTWSIGEHGWGDDGVPKGAKCFYCGEIHG